MTVNSPKNRLDLEMHGCLVWYCIMVSGERKGIWSPEYHHTLHCIPACMPMWRERNLVRTRLAAGWAAWSDRESVWSHARLAGRTGGGGGCVSQSPGQHSPALIADRKYAGEFHACLASVIHLANHQVTTCLASEHQNTS